MKASKARMISETLISNNKSEYINKLYKAIEKASYAGHSHLSVKSPDKNIISSVIKQLESDGYTVKRDILSDMRDGEFWDNLTIKW